MRLTTAAVAVMLIGSAVSAAAAQPTPSVALATPAQPRTLPPSKSAAKAIIDLDAAVRANDVANLPARFAAAEAVATSNNDKYLIASMRLKAGVAAHDNAQMIAGADGIAASGVETSGSVAAIYGAVGGELYAAKQYSQAVTELQKSLALAPGDSGKIFDLGEAQIAAGQQAAGVATMRKALTAAAAAGQKPGEDMFKHAVSAAYAAKLPEAAEIAREWVKAYPTASSWRNAIAIYRNLNHPSPQDSLDLMRLMQATGALQLPEDYQSFITTTVDQLNFNEAQNLYDAGVGGHVIDASKPAFVEIRNLLRVKAKATSADLETAIKSSPKPTYLLRIGDRFYAMGNYSRAAQVYRDVAGEPDADKDLANLHLGMALARSGNKAGATAALTAVTGARADIAKYWLLYVQEQA